jgi:hypothetical protein
MGDVVPELAIDADQLRVIIMLRPNDSPSFSVGISTGYCALLCLELGTSGAGFYARTGVGLAIDAPGLTWSNENPECSIDRTTAYVSVGIGPTQTSAGWQSGDTAGSWNGFLQRPTIGGAAPTLTKIGAATVGAGVIHWWTTC